MGGIMDIDEIGLTRLLVYGTTTPGSDPNSHIREDSVGAPAITLSMLEYLTDGAGRYARPAQAPLIDAFFSDARAAGPALPDGTYTATQVRSLLSLGSGAGSLSFAVSNYRTDAGSADFLERSYVFGGSGFAIDESLVFRVQGGAYSIENVRLVADPDDFDFQSGDSLASVANIPLRLALDPYGLIPETGGDTKGVVLNYAGDGKLYGTYGLADFLADSAFRESVDDPVAGRATLAAAVAGIAIGAGYLGNINSDPYFQYKTADGLKIVYGTPGNDTITELSAEITVDVYFGYQMVGGGGSDTITGGFFADELWGGDGVDTLNGSVGSDTIRGGRGDDLIDGGIGQDTAVFAGASSEYTFGFDAATGSYIIKDNAADRDGVDRLKDVEQARFSDKTIPLRGQDISFVIDTTGSMADDIGAVKAAATQIIEAIFNAVNGFINARASVVGFKDPGETSVFLPFTDQLFLEDRRAATQTAINAISVGGGGDFPEGVYSGLLTALSGAAGGWSSDVDLHRIILFGDAPPKDTELRPQVLALAANVGASLSGFSSRSDADGLQVTTFSLTRSSGNEAEPEVIRVEIFSVVIGGNAAALESFTDIAISTRGQVFNPDDASAVVAALLAAIEAPPAPDNAPPTSISLTPVQLIENASAGTLVGTVTVGDPDPADAHTLRFTVEDPRFILDEGGVHVANDAEIDFEDSATIELGIEATDSAGNRLATTLTISILDVAESFDGTVGNDILRGDAGRNTLRGLEGSDRLDGRRGDDELIGGGGADIFVVSPGHDTIVDFVGHTEATAPLRFLWLDVPVERPEDKIDASGLDSSFATFLTQASEVDGSVTWRVNDQTSITLAGTRLTDLTATDFVF